ncbi:MAG: helix-turn-helix transcriptional regulator [Novosphingobium sp.]|nr:helix-turn-helix transcriptional regulator [Novosphingobium sp.]MBO9603109.1 helix-turn-helix transcriptional regulator [Novosphingobium sp.]
MAERKENSGTCPVARGLDCVGDRWSMLVLRDVERGMHRFDRLQASLGIAPNILSSRLAALVEEGLLEKRRYNERPPRYEYVLTDAGRDFIPILVAIGAWGRKHRGEGALSRLLDRQSGIEIEPEVIDRVTGAPIGSRPLDLVVPEG